jgi:raffinose/stachyose/melibiose transport system substrate-binding protein
VVTSFRTPRRALVALALAAASAAALSGCGLTHTGSSAPLSVWHEFSGKSNDAMGGAIKGFDKKNPDLKFKGRAIANDQVNTVVRTGLSSKTPPTVLQYEGYQQTKDYAKAGQLLDITKWWNAHKQNFTYGDSQAVKDACEYNGKTYCIPWNVDTSEQLYYNPDLVKKYNLPMPKSIADLKTIAAKLKPTGVGAISLYAGDGWPAAHWWYLLSIQRCGVDKVLAAAKQDGAKWDDPCFKQSATDLYDLGKAGVFPKGVGGQNYNAMLQLFLSGKTAFMNTGTWFNSTLEATPPKFNAGAIPFPQVDPSKPSTQILGGFTNVFGVTAKSGNTKAGLKFLDYLADPSTGAGAAFSKNGLINVVKGADAQMKPRVKASYDTISAALQKPGENVIAYFENLVPPSVGEDQMYNGSAALTAGTETPDKFISSLQAAAAKVAK